MLVTPICNGTPEAKQSTQRNVFKTGQLYEKDEMRCSQNVSFQGLITDAAITTRQTSPCHDVRSSTSYATGKRMEKPHYPVIKDVRTLQVEKQNLPQFNDQTLSRIPATKAQLAISRLIFSEQTGDGDQTTTRNYQATPQRPQDLLDKISMDVARQNVKSSAQYRKSYAYKIWRDKGCFPYRLADQPHAKMLVQRKKSKRHLNAIRAKRDRENEEAWKAFKNGRATTNDMKYRRREQSPKVCMEETSVKVSEELYTIPASHAKDRRIRNVKYQKSIANYFKNKKVSCLKPRSLVVSPKSIPTSVIHVNTSKRSEIFKTVSHGNNCSVPSNIDNSNSIKLEIQQEVSTVKPTSKGKLLAATEEGCNSSSQWSAAQASGFNHCGEKSVQNKLDVTTVNGADPAFKTITTWCGNNFESIRGVENKTREQKLKHKFCSYELQVQNLASNSSQDNDSSIKMSQAKSERLSTVDKRIDGVDGCITVETEESKIDNAKLALIIKNSLTKKYSKENVKLNIDSTVDERSRKRGRNGSLRREEDYSGKAKKEKASMFTRLDENVAANLADGIHDVNSEYFPIEALARKAAITASKEVFDSSENQQETMFIMKKLNEIERARLLLKELFDVTSESHGDKEMKTFDTASRLFGRKNILNHLSLLDRYFAEYQKKLSDVDDSLT